MCCRSRSSGLLHPPEYREGRSGRELSREGSTLDRPREHDPSGLQGVDVRIPAESNGLESPSGVRGCVLIKMPSVHVKCCVLQGLCSRVGVIDGRDRIVHGQGPLAPFSSQPEELTDSIRSPGMRSAKALVAARFRARRARQVVLTFS